MYFLLYSVFNEHQPTVSPAVKTDLSSAFMNSQTLAYELVKTDEVGGLKWTRTTDLALIRRAL